MSPGKENAESGKYTTELGGLARGKGRKACVYERPVTEHVEDKDARIMWSAAVFA